MTATRFGRNNFTFQYDALSRRTQLTRPNGVNTSYQYDALSHLLSVLHQLNGVTLDGASYTYDPAGNRMSKTDQYTGLTYNYGYDTIYQLLQVAQGATTTESYTYDKVGNRLSSLGVSPYVYNSSNQLTSTPTATYTYDKNGNTKTKVDATGTTTYNWDVENRLTSVVLPGTGGTVSFKYDVFGRRAQKSGPNGTTNYLYDGPNLVEEVDANGNVLGRYSQYLTVDEALASMRSTVVSYYEADGLDSITSLSNSIGALANTYGYDSFGKLTAYTGTLTNPFGFTGRDLDSETGLHYYRARYYDENAGRFLSEDPIAFKAGVNFYQYTGNNPVRFLDRWGLQSEDFLDGCRLCHMMCDLKFRLDLTVVSFGAWVRGWAGAWGFGRGGNNPVKDAVDATKDARVCKLAQNICHWNCNIDDCGVAAAPPFWSFPPGWPFAKR